MQSEFEGIGKLRRGVLILIVTTIVFAIAVVIAAASILSELTSMFFSSVSASNSAIASSASSLSATIGIFIVVFLVLVILYILGYVYIRRGFKILADLGRNVRIGYTGTTLFFISLGLAVLSVIIIVIFLLAGISSTASSISNNSSLNAISSSVSSGLSTISSGIYVGLAVFIIGVIIQLVSSILIGIGFFKVGDEYKEGTTKWGGILFIIGTVLSLIPSSATVLIGALISFISLILIYVGLGGIKPMSAIMSPTPLPQSTYQPPTAIQLPTVPQTLPTSPQVYQVGQGVIRADGSAFITLYTSTQAIITSVRVEGIKMNAVMVNPVVLQPGQNAIVIKFDNASQLAPGNSYVITIDMNVGGNLVEIKAVANYYP